MQALDGVTFGVADGRSWAWPAVGLRQVDLGKSLIRLTRAQRHVGGHVELDGEELPIADNEAMNPSGSSASRSSPGMR